MIKKTKKPRVLIVTPEVTYLPEGMGNLANNLSAKAGGLADVSAALIGALYSQGGDVHVALPDYRAIFEKTACHVLKRETDTIREQISEDRIHFAEDRAFYYLDRIYSNYGAENSKIALAFQREVINNIIPRVKPDLIHCNDWMTGLIPAFGRAHGIPCLFTVHNIHTVKDTMATMEDKGIDAADFWDNLFFERKPEFYEESRGDNYVDFLVSGIFAAHFVNTVSPTFLKEIVDGCHSFVSPTLQQELKNKWVSGCATGILNSPDVSYNPVDDNSLEMKYSPATHVAGKRGNKKALQKRLGILEDANAPVFFWPSRLDRVQKGCQLLADITYNIISRYWDQNLQIVFVADGEFKGHFLEILDHHRLYDRIAITAYDERLERLAYGGSDFVLMPSSFEPCGLPQMSGAIYGSLPVVHNTGGLHDTVSHLDPFKGTGNGFIFDVYDSDGLNWAVDQAMAFHMLPERVKNIQRERIMKESASTFTHVVTARKYIDLYEKMLEKPFIT